jgi:hypothetical protein
LATLYSYIVREDHGFAPNPYGGVLTLTCCKPDMRLQAQPSDYVAGISGADHPAGRKLLLLAAKITDRMTMTAYRDWAESECTDKIPGPVPPHRKIGDAMYIGPDLVRDRRGYHDRSNRAEDVRGRYALLSRFPTSLTSAAGRWNCLNTCGRSPGYVDTTGPGRTKTICRGSWNGSTAYRTAGCATPRQGVRWLTSR